MKIAIIGSGNVGKALAGSFARAGHDVVIGSAHPENAEAAANESGAQAAPSLRAAVAGRDAVVLAVPYASVVPVLDEIGDALRGTIVIDVTNPLRADYMGLATEGTSAAENIQARVPAARVVKAFNTAFAARQAEPKVDGIAVDGFVAADDEEAKTAVLELVRSIGFYPIDAGPLEMARALEAMALLNVTLQLRNSWAWQTGWKLVGPREA
jgi:8-hydroxy-5-deazaflavin:NADPH oxidoreductase